jgi:hypothetical protein
MTAYLVPLNPTPQRFSIFLSGVEYIISYRWNAISSTWVLNIYDVNGLPIATGLPLVTGSDLLAQLAYLGISGKMVVQSNNDPGAVPTVESLGTTGNLYYLQADT